MSKIRDLKTNPDNCFNVVEAIELFTPKGKSKYVDMLLRVMNSTPNLKEHGDEIISHMTTTFDFIDKEDFKKFNPIQLLLMYKFTETYFNTEDLHNFKKFCDYNERNLVEQNDLSTYKSFEDIITQVNIAEIKVEMKELENEVVRVHEDDEWLLVRPMTFLASKKYGANTKWCTTQERYWNDYYKTYKLIYIQNKRTNEKYAVSRHWEDNKKVQAWMSNDDESSPMLLPLPIEVMSVILCEVNKTDTIFELQSKHNIRQEEEVVVKKRGSSLDYPTVWDSSTSNIVSQSSDRINPYSNGGYSYDDTSMMDLLRRLRGEH